ncbi:MAG: hypothetical protein ACPGVG_10785 [Mycobacterium sp.]
MTSEGFATYWAVRLPDGTLWSPPGQCEAAKSAAEQYHNAPSFIREVLGAMGVQEPPAKPPAPVPMVFINEDDAQALCSQLREQAMSMGVTHWYGHVVSALRTPFTAKDPSVEFAEQVAQWMATECGGNAR